VPDDDPARVAILDELSRTAIQTYGEERAAQFFVQAMLKSTASALWRVSQEPLEPTGDEP
jgi:hypothetical protein